MPLLMYRNENKEKKYLKKTIRIKKIQEISNFVIR